MIEKYRDLRPRRVGLLMEEEVYPFFKEFVYGWKEVVGPEHFTLGRARPPDVGEPEDG